ncbi:MAG: type II restriction endonuclease [Bacteroidales bacterium]|nr:type II restriction endonuclease [Bacteroidales bacterium]MBR0292689.1 type II restriction endonuclease [Bacteroidales bacterium]
MMAKFDVFLSQLKETNATLGFFTDFSKVSSSVAKIAVKLNQLNYLLGKDNLRAAVELVYNENPKAFEVLDILVAVRKKDKKLVLNEKLQPVLLESFFNDVDSICTYIEGTGLGDVFRSKKITNLVDYVFGVEVGLDTNARKNRSGKLMAEAVAKVFAEANVAFEEEVNSTTFNDLKGLGKDLKRFDFVIRKKDKTFLIETNFYNDGGSKPNEVARSYSDIAPKINANTKYEFVWITDGQGWLSAKNKLEEAYGIIPRVYNLTTLPSFVEEIKKMA